LPELKICAESILADNRIIMPEKSILKHTAAIVLALFAVLSLTIYLRWWQAFDQQALLTLQTLVPRAVDLPFSLLSLVGSAEVTGVTFLALVWLAPPARRVPLLVTFGLVALIELIGKTVLNHPGVPHEFRRYLFQITIPSSELRTAFSYPSGHAARTTYLVIVFAMMLAVSRWSRASKSIALAVLLALEALMLVSRVYLGEHWTSDVIGGTLLGGGFALIALAWEIKLPAMSVRRIFDTRFK
jgi:membrane-associated phospholipid phosphatase